MNQVYISVMGSIRIIYARKPKYHAMQFIKNIYSLHIVYLLFVVIILCFAGKWSTIQGCLDYNILPDSVNTKNITEKELISLLIDEVKLNIAKRSAYDPYDTSTVNHSVAYPPYVSESWFLGIVVGAWNVLPWLILLIHYLSAKYCRGASIDK